ncbi:hypothetical protein SAMN05444397_101353 [Flavobacterium aquidurense]|uniref:Lipoprotein n=1 Tax=Flavobacterium frigidimaris TaxID=262320 RepID=A0ABX4BLB8_FLAFR|nr:hypothetical protein [Flavobacterium frigidimaris]OXA76145.1 hypothetical protein B0A65_20065 [Flavobacterium frigidimaris]SDY32920.1 hypothetical protein SAMN05444397_101353 [Flavobacterium aquidurense]
MKKVLLFSVIIALSFSCAKKVSEEKKESKEVSKPAKKDTTPAVVVGGDSDSHGCKASAGYNWSILKKECIRIFENSTKLSHAEDGKTYSTVAYVIFDGDKAELFLDTQKESIILERKSEGDSWVKDDLQLIPWKGYVLKKGEKIIYTGE